MEAPAYHRRRSRLGHRQSIAAGFLLAAALLACAAQAWLPNTGSAGVDEALPGEDPPELDSVRAPARPPVKEQAARKLEVGSSGRIAGPSRPSRSPLVPRQQQPPVLSAAPYSPELQRSPSMPSATKAGPLARSAPRVEPVRLPGPEPELPAEQPSRQEPTIATVPSQVLVPPPVAQKQEVLPARPATPESPPVQQRQDAARVAPPVIEPPPVAQKQEVLPARPATPESPPIRQGQDTVRAVPPPVEPPPFAQKQEVLPTRPATPESPPVRQVEPKEEAVTAQRMLIQPEPGPEPSALTQRPGRELLAPSALDMRRLRRAVGREGSQLAVGPGPAEQKPDGGNRIAARPQEMRAGPVRLPPVVAERAAAPPVRLPPVVAEAAAAPPSGRLPPVVARPVVARPVVAQPVVAQPAAAGPPVRLPPLAAQTPEPRPVRLPQVDHVAAVGPMVSPEPEVQPVEPAGEAVMVTDDAPPRSRDSLPQVARQWESVAAGPLRLTLKTSPPPKTSSWPQPERPVAAAARQAPMAADPKGNPNDRAAGADGEEGVAFASDSEETPQRPLQLSVKDPSRDVKPAERTKQAPDGRTNR